MNADTATSRPPVTAHRRRWNPSRCDEWRRVQRRNGQAHDGRLAADVPPATFALQVSPSPFLLVLFALLLAAAPARAQLVPDGGTNFVDGIVTNVPGTNYIGSNAPYSILVITNGGVVSNDFGIVGLDATSINNTVIVHGPGSRWDHRRDLIVGHSGGWNRLLITNGGTVTASNLIVGFNSASTNNRVTVDGGSVIVTNAAGTGTLDIRRGTNVLNAGLIVADTLLLTNSAGFFDFNGGTLITRGGTNSNGRAFVVGASGTTSAILDLRSNAPLVLSNGFTLGANTAAVGNQLLITNGGTLRVAVGFSVIGTNATASNNLALVSGPGSLWTNGTFHVGLTGSGNQLVVSYGGTVVSGFGRIGFNSTASNNVAVVTGPGSLWTNRNELYVGWMGSGNQLMVSNGGVVANTFGFLGYDPTASNNVAAVTGPGSLWSNSGSLHIGFNGSGNQLVVSNGGTVSATNVTVGYDTANFAANRVTVDGGTLRVTNAGGTAVLDIRRGTNVLNAGLIVADKLLLTNSAGFFNFNGGTLNVRSATVGNSRIFTAGNGTSDATYRMSGVITNGHTFSNGLVISPNATLSGNGTITGNVTNFGTLAPGSSAGSLTINGDLVFQPSATAVFELGGRTATNGYDQVSVTNFVQFAGTLDLRLTNNFLPAPGDAFTLVKFASSSGVFNGVWNGLRIPFFGGKASFFVTYDTNLTLSAVQYLDTDGDGQPDLFEQAAGTDAASAASVLRLVPVSVSAAGAVTLRFPYVSGKSYQMQWRNNVSTNAWSVITTPVLVETVPGFYDWVDDGTLTGGLATPTRAYRVGLAP